MTTRVRCTPRGRPRDRPTTDNPGGPDWVVAVGTLGTVIALSLFAFAKQSGVALAASTLAGVSWIAVLATVNVSAQVALTSGLGPRPGSFDLKHCDVRIADPPGVILGAKLPRWLAYPEPLLLPRSVHSYGAIVMALETPDRRQGGPNAIYALARTRRGNGQYRIRLGTCSSYC